MAYGSGKQGKVVQTVPAVWVGTIYSRPALDLLKIMGCSCADKTQFAGGRPGLVLSLTPIYRSTTRCFEV
jgi:hypothetical protein